MVLFNSFKKLKAKNATWKEQAVSNLLSKNETILDYGCGDLLFAQELLKNNSSLKITGVDVVSAPKSRHIKFIKYKGDKLPFKENSFDTVISVYVFHHCKDAKIAFADCLRVAKKRVIFIEAIAKNKMEIYPMKFMDWFFNVWKPEPIPLTFQFKTISEWRSIFKGLKVKKAKGKEIKNPIKLMPISEAYLFEVYK